MPDAATLEAAFRAEYGGLCAFACRYVRSSARAEDVVQEVFLELWRGGATVRIRTSIRAYLYRGVRNRALNAIDRGRLRDRVLQLLGHAEPLTFDPPDQLEETNPESTDRHTELRAALARLPPRTGLAITLRYLHELSQREAAEAMGISVKGVERLVSIGLRRLRSQLSPGAM